MGSLQNSAGSIGALKARFESKASAQNELRSGFRAANFTSPHKAEDIMPVMNGIISSVPLKRSSGEQKPKIPADAPVSDANTDAKEDRVTRKVDPITSLKVQLWAKFEEFSISITDQTRTLTSENIGHLLYS